MSHQIPLPLELPFRYYKLVKLKVDTYILFDPKDNIPTTSGKWLFARSLSITDEPLIVEITPNIAQEAWEGGCSQHIISILASASTKGISYLWLTWDHD